MAPARIKLEKFSGAMEDGSYKPGDAGSSEEVRYTDWRFKLRTECDAICPAAWPWMDRHVDEDDDGEEVPAPAVAGAENIRKMTELKRALVASLSGEALRVVQGSEEQDAQSLLRALDDKYHSQSKTSRISVILKLISKKKEDGESVDDFVSEVKRLMREELRGDISVEEVLLGVLCRGLPQEYDDLVSTIMGADEEVRMDDLVRKLRDREIRVAGRRTEVTAAGMNAVTDSFNKLSVNDNKGRKGKGKGKGKKGKGKGKNGKKGVPAVKKNNEKKPAKDLSHIQCYVCWGYGHYSDKCPSAKKS